LFELAVSNTALATVQHQYSTCLLMSAVWVIGEQSQALVFAMGHVSFLPPGKRHRVAALLFCTMNPACLACQQQLQCGHNSVQIIDEQRWSLYCWVFGVI
jgi:hypothetical protein